MVIHRDLASDRVAEHLQDALLKQPWNKAEGILSAIRSTGTAAHATI